MYDFGFVGNTKTKLEVLAFYPMQLSKKKG